MAGGGASYGKMGLSERAETFWRRGLRGAGQVKTSDCPRWQGLILHSSQSPARTVRDAGVSDAHLYPILGKEGTGIGLHGQLEAGSTPPEWTASEEQASSPFLAAAVAFAKEVWGGRGFMSEVEK